MAKDKIEIEVLAKGVKEAQKDVEKLKKQIEGTGPAGKKTGSILQSSWLKIAGVATTVAVAVKKAFDISKGAAKFNQSVKAMETQFGVSSSKIIKRLKEVSKGTISNTDIVSAANKAMALNVTKDLDEMAQLMEVARVRGQAMGLDTTQAFEDIVTGIGRGCLRGDMKVLTPRGEVNIKDIKKGQTVLTFNDKGNIVQREVIHIYDNGIAQLFKIVTEHTEIYATEIHAFKSKDKWIKTRDLKKGIELNTIYGNTKVISVEKDKEDNVYDIAVEKENTYIANNIENHNSPLILDNLGIITKGWADEAKGAGKAMDAQFILSKVLADGAKILEKTGEVVLTDAERFQKLSAIIANGSIAFGQKLLPAVNSVLGGLIKLIEPEKDLVQTTSDLIKYSKEYEQITKKLATESANLTAAELSKLNVRKSELKLKIVETIANVNKQYKNQKKLIAETATELKKQNKIKTDSAKIIQDIENGTISRMQKIKDDANNTVGVYDALEAAHLTYGQSSVAVAKIEDNLIKGKDKLRESIATINFGLKNEIVTKGNLIALDDELIKKAQEYNEAVIVTAPLKENDIILTDAQVLARQKLIDQAILLGVSEQELTKLTNEEVQKRVDKEIEARKKVAKVYADYFGNITDSLFDFSKSWKERLGDMFKTTIDTIATQIKARGLAMIAASVFPTNPAGLAGGAGMIAASSTIKGLAGLVKFRDGTDFSPGSRALVGEDGPEILNLPQGSKVEPNNTIDNESINNSKTTINVSSPNAIEFVNELQQTYGINVFEG